MAHPIVCAIFFLWGSCSCVGFTPFSNSLIRGFVHLDSKGTFKISKLESASASSYHGTTITYESFWVRRKLEQKATVHKVVHIAEHRCFIIAVSIKRPVEMSDISGVPAHTYDKWELRVIHQSDWQCRCVRVVRCAHVRKIKRSLNDLDGSDRESKYAFDDFEHVLAMSVLKLRDDETFGGLKIDPSFFFLHTYPDLFE